jgi:hypothetical protein
MSARTVYVVVYTSAWAEATYVLGVHGTIEAAIADAKAQHEARKDRQDVYAVLARTVDERHELSYTHSDDYDDAYAAASLVGDSVWSPYDSWLADSTTDPSPESREELP